MSKNFTVATLKINNKKSTLNHIYTQKHSTPQILHDATSLSRPTIAQILKELQDEHLIYQEGLADSTGGRKASLYKFNASVKITIGVELLIDHFEIVAVDLYGETLKFEKSSLPFCNHADYFNQICSSINKFIESLSPKPEQILGVGLALQALISSDGKHIIYGKILKCTGLDIEEFNSRIPYPCTFNHDAESGANVELWMNPLLRNAIYFNIRSDLSGAIIIERQFFKGGEYKSGVFEHMTIIPGGAPCYCGKQGCVNSYCSISALLKRQEDLQHFFFMLRKGTSSYVKRWNQYLVHLATAIDNLHMAINCDIILGGTLSRHLINEDIIMEHLEERAEIVLEDFGASKGQVVLYPDLAYKVADAVATGAFDRAILVCGTGIGMAICANKVPGIRAAVCHDPFSTERSRKSNNAQIICMGERVIGSELAKCLVDIWLNCDFSGGPSAPKVDRINLLEQAHMIAK